MPERVIVRYSECFKREVIAALESGRCASMAAARVHFGIRGSTTIAHWLKRLGRNDLCTKVVRVEKPDEADRIQELRKQVAKLERALGQTQAQNLLNEEFLRRACQRLGEDLEAFKKKSAGMPCTGSPAQDDVPVR